MVRTSRGAVPQGWAWRSVRGRSKQNELLWCPPPRELSSRIPQVANSPCDAADDVEEWMARWITIRGLGDSRSLHCRPAARNVDGHPQLAGSSRSPQAYCRGTGRPTDSLTPDDLSDGRFARTTTVGSQDHHSFMSVCPHRLWINRNQSACTRPVECS
jgi:hypothetical protein